MAFVRGQSGNPSGRPKGRGNQFGPKLLERHSRPLLLKLVERALGGDIKALEICVDRLLPRLKARMAPVSLPANAVSSLADQGRSVVSAALVGEIDPDQAQSLLSGLVAQARIVEISDLEQRIAALEQGHTTPSLVVTPRPRTPLLSNI